MQNSTPNRPYTEELVYVDSEDGLLLEGAIIRPSGVPARDNVVLWVHGLTGRFYSRSTINIGRALASHGYTFVTGNNRGHDFGAVYRTSTGEVNIQGGGWERFDESPRDVGAWLSFAASLDAGGVVLAGHSLGALKVAYYQAQRQDPRVVALVAASPPVRAGQRANDAFATAKQMVDSGRGRDLLPWDSQQAGAGTSSAQTLVNRVETNIDVYGVSTPNAPITQIRCPLLALYGTDEEWVGTGADLDMIRRNAVAAPRVDTRLFDGADHNYNGHEAEVAAGIAEWIQTL